MLLFDIPLGSTLWLNTAGYKVSYVFKCMKCCSFISFAVQVFLFKYINLAGKLESITIHCISQRVTVYLMELYRRTTLESNTYYETVQSWPYYPTQVYIMFSFKRVDSRKIQIIIFERVIHHYWQIQCSRMPKGNTSYKALHVTSYQMIHVTTGHTLSLLTAFSSK